MIKVSIYFIFIVLSGCGYLKYANELLALKSVGDSQLRIEKYLNKQEESFGVLIEDIKSEKFKKGISKREVLKLYGEPVLSEVITDESVVKEVFLYRHPTNYFTSDRVYLYFDSAETLLYREYIPYKTNN